MTTKNQKRISLTVSDEVFAVISWLAEVDKRTVSNFLTVVIDEKFRDHLLPTETDKVPA